MFSTLKGLKCWVWGKATVLSHSNPMKFCLVVISIRSTLSYSGFIFSSFFWRKQKINVSKSGLHKPNLKLMSISTAEGHMWKQRFILEVWPGLVSLALTQRADSQACQEFPRDFQAEASLEASECAARMCCSLPHCRGTQYVSTSSHSSLSQYAPKTF